MSKWLFSIVPLASAFLVPVAVRGQVAPERPPKVITGPVYKYEAYAGWGYTSLNQVNQSRSGLQGVSASITRDIGDHFGVKIDGGHYAWSVTSTNPGKPTVDMILVGPVVRGEIWEKWSGYAEGLFGGIHTGGESIQPPISFAGGFGIGIDYNRSARLSVRLFADDIGSAFTLAPYQTGYSTHTRFNARAGIGLVYHF